MWAYVVMLCIFMTPLQGSPFKMINLGGPLLAHLVECVPDILKLSPYSSGVGSSLTCGLILHVIPSLSPFPVFSYAI